METAIAKQTWPITKPVSLQEIETLDKIIISGAPISVSTSHEACIREDQYQLSSLVKKDLTTVRENIEEFSVGNDVVASGVAVRQIVQNVDKSKVHDLITVLVIDVFEFFDKEYKSSLCRSTAELIYKNYYFLKFSELKLFVERIKGGYWQQKHNMSPAVLMERLKEFAEESYELRESMAAEDHSKQLQQPQISEEAKKLFTDFAQAMAKKHKLSLFARLDKGATEMQNEIQRIKDNNFCFDWLRGDCNEMLAVQPSKAEKKAWYHLFINRK